MALGDTHSVTAVAHSLTHSFRQAGRQASHNNNGKHNDSGGEEVVGGGGADAVPRNGQNGNKVTQQRWRHSPFVRLIDDVADLHVEGPVLRLQTSICGPFWKKNKTTNNKENPSTLMNHSVFIYLYKCSFYLQLCDCKSNLADCKITVTLSRCHAV